MALGNLGPRVGAMVEIEGHGAAHPRLQPRVAGLGEVDVAGPLGAQQVLAEHALDEAVRRTAGLAVPVDERTAARSAQGADLVAPGGVVLPLRHARSVFPGTTTPAPPSIRQSRGLVSTGFVGTCSAAVRAGRPAPTGRGVASPCSSRSLTTGRLPRLDALGPGFSDRDRRCGLAVDALVQREHGPRPVVRAGRSALRRRLPFRLPGFRLDLEPGAR